MPPITISALASAFATALATPTTPATTATATMTGWWGNILTHIGVHHTRGNWQGLTFPHTLIMLEVCKHTCGGDRNCPQKLWYVNTKN
jgi:hypothetical protein